MLLFKILSSDRKRYATLMFIGIAGIAISMTIMMIFGNVYKQVKLALLAPYICSFIVITSSSMAISVIDNRDRKREFCSLYYDMD